MTKIEVCLTTTHPGFWSAFRQGVLSEPKPSSGIDTVISVAWFRLWLKYDLLDGRWERRVASALPSRLHDITGLCREGGNRRGLTSFGLWPRASDSAGSYQHWSVARSGVSSVIFDLIGTRFDNHLWPFKEDPSCQRCWEDSLHSVDTIGLIQ